MAETDPPEPAPDQPDRPIDDGGDHIPLEPVESSEPTSTAPTKASVSDLDVCPNCTAPMPAADQLVCLRCGFDLKTLSVIDTEKSEELVEAAPAPGSNVLLRKGILEPWLPLGVAAAGFIALLIGILSGWVGLYPDLQFVAAEADRTVIDVPWSDRGVVVLRLLAALAMWWGCAIGALLVTARLVGMVPGDVKTVAFRALACVSAALVVMLFDLHRSIEHLTELVAGAAVYAALSMVFFRLKPRDAATLAGITLSMFMVVYLGARIITWVTV
ncbi:MAG: hypothetical protein AAF432_11130 [Planctomycetota bacterium]